MKYSYIRRCQILQILIVTNYLYHILMRHSCFKENKRHVGINNEPEWLRERLFCCVRAFLSLYLQKMFKFKQGLKLTKKKAEDRGKESCVSVCFGGWTPSLKKFLVYQRRRRGSTWNHQSLKHVSQSGVDLLHLHPLWVHLTFNSCISY